MWIKVLLCISDQEYAGKMSNYFDKEYADKMEVNMFSDVDNMLNYLHNYGADIVLFDEAMEASIFSVKNQISCLCVKLVDRLYENEKKDYKQIAKYQRADRLYKTIIEIYSEGGMVRQIQKKQELSSECKVYLFVSPKGGVGTTTVSYAFARRCAAYEKILYLNLRVMGGYQRVGEGDEPEHKGMDELLMALKSRRNILPLKIQSSIHTGADKVDTYGVCSNPLDLLEINRENINELICCIKDNCEYKKIVIDVGSDFTWNVAELYKMCDEAVCVVDDKILTKSITSRYINMIHILEKKEGVKLSRKVSLFFNKCNRDIIDKYDDLNLKTAGWVPIVPNDVYENCIDRIANSDAFEDLGV